MPFVSLWLTWDQRSDKEWIGFLPDSTVNSNAPQRTPHTHTDSARVYIYSQLQEYFDSLLTHLHWRLVSGYCDSYSGRVHVCVCVYVCALDYSRNIWLISRRQKGSMFERLHKIKLLVGTSKLYDIFTTLATTFSRVKDFEKWLSLVSEFLCQQLGKVNMIDKWMLVTCKIHLLFFIVYYSSLYFC